MTEERLKELHEQIEELERQDRFLELVPLFEECLKICLAIYGENHDETLKCYIEFGGLLRNLGRYEESLAMLQKALRIVAATRGTDHLDYASTLVNLANLLRMMEHNEESERLFLKAKELFEAKNAVTLVQYASLCNNLGLLYQQMGRDLEAIPLHQICLSIFKTDPEYAMLYGVTLNNLVDPYKHTGQRDKAIDCLKQSISIFRKHINRAVLLYATALNNLGIIYYEDGNYQKALDCFKIALDTSKKKLGTQSEAYIYSKRNYEQALSKVQKEACQDGCKGTFLQYDGIENGQDNIYHVQYLADKQRQDLPRSVQFAEACEAGQGAAAAPGSNIDINIKGLALCEAYFYDVCYPMLQKEFAKELPRMAAGLVGEGSECYGFDDQISRDHDFGPSFQIFIPKEDMDVYGGRLKEKLAALPDTYGPFEARNACELGEGRTGLLAIEDFYDKFLSIHEVPKTNRLWLAMNDNSLSTATNGKVFFDNLGVFTQIREGLLKHYPDDVRIKRLAYECTQIAQSGQYNFPRSLQRGQYVAASLALNEFLHHYMSFVYLINRVYKPYYKWEHEGLKKLPIFGQMAHRELGKLVLIPLEEKASYAVFVVESLCKKAIQLLVREKLTDCKSDFLLDHAGFVLSHAEDEAIRFSNPWLER